MQTKVFVATCILLLYACESLGKVPKSLLENVSDKLSFVNAGLGTMSRSISLEQAHLKLKGEYNEENNEAFILALISLTVCDVGGTILVPMFQSYTETLMKEETFTKTQTEMLNYNKVLKEKLDGVDDFKNLNKQEINTDLNKKKEKIMATFDNDLKWFKEVKDFKKTNKLYKSLSSAMTWMRTKTVAKALGPIIDTIGVGISAYNLYKAVEKCRKTPCVCDRNDIIANSIGIASGLIGVGTFLAVLAGNYFGLSALVAAGPIGAAIGVTLAICGTLIELFWPRSQPTIKHRIRMSYKFDMHSRSQLWLAKELLKGSPNNIYVNNQATLATLILEHDTSVGGVKADSTKISFENATERFYVYENGKCSKPEESSTIYMKERCKYLKVGKLRSYEGKSFGPDFYGFAPPDDSMYFKYNKSGRMKEPVKGGSTILINTDIIDDKAVSNTTIYEKTIKKVNKELRGVYVDVKSAESDLVAIGNMKNLKAGNKIKIHLDSAKGSALNINGYFGELKKDYKGNMLDANLADNGVPNTLNFLGMDKRIRGIAFNKKNMIGRLEYFYTGTNNEMKKKLIGYVRNIHVLVASKGKDHIVLNGQRPSIDKDGQYPFDFSVYNFKGQNFYEVDFRKTTGDSLTEKLYKIIDTSTNSRIQDYTRRCDDHAPQIYISNLPNDAVKNDVIYNGTHLMIHANRAGIGTGKSSHKSTFKYCKKESEERGGIGNANGKELMVTVEVVSTCMPSVRAITRSNTCLLKRPLSDVNVKLFGGKDLTVDFKSNKYTGISKNDLVTLKCPTDPIPISNSITINLRGGEDDTVVLRKDTFLDPCDIDGQVAKLTLKFIEQDKWELGIEEVEEKFTGDGKKHNLIGVKKIINEFGTTIIDLSEHEEGDSGKVLDLYEFYRDNILPQVAEGKNKDIADEWKQCYKSSEEIKKDKKLKDICQSKGIDE